MNNQKPAKRVDLVWVKLVKEGSILYGERRITHPRSAIDLVRVFLADVDREVVVVCCLNTKNEPTHLSIVSIGSLSASVLHPREVFKAAILANAAGIILFHNHPSGDPTPSKEDILISKKIFKGGDMLGIPLLDHLILGESDSFVSLKENGELV